MGTYKYPDIATAHEGVVKTVIHKGYAIRTEDDELTIEFEPTTIIIENPFSGKRISTHSSFSENYMNAYSDALIEGYNKNIEFVYDYHSRLFDYNHNDNYDYGLDQIGYIIYKLKTEPTSRRAQAITWMPEKDSFAKDVPCLQLIQCTIRDNKLNMNVVFRSNDMLMAFGANAYALTMLQKYICSRLDGIKNGVYTHTALIPHIYRVRDIDELNKFLEY